MMTWNVVVKVDIQGADREGVKKLKSFTITGLGDSQKTAYNEAWEAGLKDFVRGLEG